MENLNNSPIWSLPFSSFLTISTNSGGKYSNSAVVFIFFLSSSNIQTQIIFRVLLPKPQCVKLFRQKLKHVDAKIQCFDWILFTFRFFIYIGYNLFTNSTSGNRKNAKLLKDKQFELRKVTGAVVAYSSSLFCTQRFDWLDLKMLESFVSVLPCDWFTLSGWPRFQ